jgi:hypothetical protein
MVIQIPIVQTTEIGIPGTVAQIQRENGKLRRRPANVKEMTGGLFNGKI